MNENPPRQTRVEDLLAQDTQVSSFRFEAFRMNLEVSIQHLEQRARAVRRASLWGMGIFIACILSALPIQFFELSWVLPVWSGCGTVALLTTMVLTGIYSYRYRPALKRARNDLQLTMIARLQQRVADLSRKLDS